MSGSEASSGSSSATVETFRLLKRSRAVSLLVGIILIVIAIWALVNGDVAVKFAAILIGIAFGVSGIGALIDAFAIKGEEDSPWLLVALVGILNIAVGALAIFWPGITVAVVGILAGANLVVTGAILLFASQKVKKEWGGGTHYVARGIFAILLGLAFIFMPYLFAGLLLLIVSIYLIVFGVVLIATSFTLGRAEKELKAGA